MAPKAGFQYEFGGPWGTLATTLLLPVLVLVLIHWSDLGRVDFAFVTAFHGSHSIAEVWRAAWQSHVLCPQCATNPTLLLQCAVCLIGWFLFQVVLERFLPCEVVEGVPVKGNPNHRLTYRINGHLAFWVTLLLVQVGWPYWHDVVSSSGRTSQTSVLQLGSVPLELLYQHTPELALACIALCFLLSVYLYLSSFRSPNVIVADGGNSGHVLYDFFMGRELNPRVLKSFDWKVFCELRPGMIGWMLLNLSCLKVQYQTLGYVTGSMLLLNVFQGLYVWDALYQERAILTTMDVTTDGFGYMLAFGDMTWVPFTYSLQARYLVQHDPHLSPFALACIVALYLIGYTIFRASNSQKDAYRRNPNDVTLKHLTYLSTKRGTRLLTSGWWGLARKINYTGDWIMGLTWCLVCGFDSLVPYYYAIYFAILLIHRSIRDDHLCQLKYGNDWDTYKQLVPYRFIPGVV